MTDILVSLEKIKEGLKIIESGLDKVRPIARLKTIEALDLFWKGLSGSPKIREGSFEYAFLQMKAGKQVRRKAHDDKVLYVFIQQGEGGIEPKIYFNVDGPGNISFAIPDEDLFGDDWYLVSMRLFKFDDSGAVYTIAARDQKEAEELFALNLVEEGREDEDIKLKVSEYEDDYVFKEMDEDRDKVREVTAKQLAFECKVGAIIHCSEW